MALAVPAASVAPVGAAVAAAAAAAAAAAVTVDAEFVDTGVSNREKQGCAVSCLEQRRCELIDEDFVQREVALQEQLEDKDRKLVAASRALQRVRGQLRQATAQLGLKDIQCVKLDVQVSQLQHLLVEKERRLQDAFDKAATATARQVAMNSEPQEPPIVCASGPERDPLDQLMCITRELTVALRAAHEAEHELRQNLQSKECKHTECERELASERQHGAEQGVQLERLRCEIQEQERAMALDRAHMAELRERAARVEIEERLQQAFVQKGKSQKQWHSHFEV